MAAGLPVVATDVGGLREVVEDGRTGYLIAPGDTEGLARAMTELFSDCERARSMGSEGRRKAESEFSVEVCAASTISLYADLLKRKREGRR
jgi:glycosyltransferase involved in cell wall biosynthesis